MSRFEIKIKTSESAPTIAVSGEFDLAAAEAFHEEVEALLFEPVELLVVDLRDLTFLDSSGLTELIQLYKRDDFTLAILRPPPKVAVLFELTGLDQHLPLYDPDAPLTHKPRRG